MSFIKDNSKEITESYLTTKDKTATGKSFGISVYGVETALYYQGYDQFISPSVLRILKSKTPRALEVAGVPPSSVVSPQRTPTLVGSQIGERERELSKAREWAYQYWKANPYAKSAQIKKELEDAIGEVVALRTVCRWLTKWKRGNLPEESISPMPRVLDSDLTWEDVLQAVPDKIELALLVLDGITKVIADERQRNSELLKELDTASETIVKLSGQVEAITEDRKNLMQEFNQLVSKSRSGGHFTIDQTKHMLVPKV